MLTVKTFTFNSFGEHTYIVKDENGHVAVVDPSFYDESERRTFYEELDGASVDMILLTHGHFDHVFGVASLAADFPSAPVYMSPLDEMQLSINEMACNAMGLHAPAAFSYVPVPEEITFGSRTVKVLPTPGHTAGSVSYFFEADKILFSGDTLFEGTIGRSDLPGGDYDALMKSVWSLMDGIPSDTDVLPGHAGATSIGREATTNPMLIPIEAYVDKNC